MAKVGRPKSENPKKDRVTIRLKEDQLARLEAYAKEFRMSKSEIMTKALDLFLGKGPDETNQFENRSLSPDR